MDETKKCAHKACKCQVAEGSDYCGTYCEQAKVEHQAGDGCGCGHDACKRDALMETAST